MGPLGVWERGAEVPLQPSHVNPGLAGAGVQRHRGGRRKRGAQQERRGRDGGGERERGRKSKGESRVPGSAGDGGGGQGGSHRSCIQSNQWRQGEGGWGGRGVKPGRKGCLGNRAQLPPLHCIDGKTEARMPKGPASRPHSQAQVPNSQMRRNPSLWGAIELDTLLSFTLLPLTHQSPGKHTQPMDVLPVLPKDRSKEKKALAYVVSLNLNLNPWLQVLSCLSYTSAHFEDGEVEARREWSWGAL